MASLAACALLATTAYAHPQAKDQPEGSTGQSVRILSKGLSLQSGFMENKGQILDQDGRPRHDVLYLFSANGFRLQLRRTGFSYEWLRNAPASGGVSEATGQPVGGSSSGSLSVSRVDVEFLGASIVQEVHAARPFAAVTNYYLEGLPVDGVLQVRSYGSVAYRGLYPGIDLVFSVTDPVNAASGPGLEYSFVVHPGGKAEDIRLRYSGSLPVLSADGVLRIPSPNGEVAERIPFSYTVAAADASDVTGALLRTTPIRVPDGARACAAHFAMDGEVLSFAVSGARSGETLVIDPTVQWSTYYGGAGEDRATGVGADASDNVLVTGTTKSAGNIATNGAHQTALAGDADGFVVKLNSSGNRQWATYFGGADEERSALLRVVGTGTIVVNGTTSSTAGIATAGAFQTTPSGGRDGYIVKFNGSGVRQWGTYVGSFDDDDLYGMSMNSGGFIAVCGMTASTFGVASAGAHQTVYGGGAHDGFVSLFTNSGGRVWSTFYGGSGDDVCRGVAFDTTGGIAVTGFTTSASGISYNGQQNTIGGSGDAFVVLLNSLCARQWATYHGGPDDDEGLSIVRGPGGAFYVSGFTLSQSGIATPGAFLPSSPGMLDGFLARYANNGILQWCTYAGGGENDIIYDIAADANGDIFLAGWTESQGGIATPGSHQIMNGGSGDASINKFSSAGSMVWGSYFGGTEAEQGVAVAVDGGNVPTLVGVTASTADITTSGAHQTNYGGGVSDGFIARFFGGASGHSIVTSITPDTLCAGSTLTIPFTAAGQFNVNNEFLAQLSNNFGSFSFPSVIGQISGTGSGVIAATIPPYMVEGSQYRIRIVSTSPAITGTDNGRDIVILALPDTTVTITGSIPICAGDSVTLCAGYRPRFSYQWMKGGVPIPGAKGVCYSVRDTGVYSVRILNRLHCPIESRGIRVSLISGPSVTVAPAGPISLCDGETIVLRATATPPSPIQWQRDGFDIPGETNETLTVGAGGVYNAIALGGNGCKGRSDTVLVIVLPKPDASVLPPGPIRLCREDSVKLQAAAGAAAYQWLRDAAEIGGAQSAQYHAKQSGQYQVRVTGANGCIALSRIIVIDLDPLPASIIAPPGPHVICDGEAVQLTAPPGCACLMQWYRDGTALTGETFPTLIARASGNYTLMLSSPSGCKSVSPPVTVTVKPAPPVALSADRREVCIGDSIVLRVTAPASATLIWRRDGADLPAVAGASRVVRESGTYSVTAHDTNGCSAESLPLSVRVIAFPSVTMTMTGSNPLCQGDSITLAVRFESEVLYRWYRNGQVLASDTTERLVVRDAGTYLLIAAHVVGCADTSLPVAITLHPRPSASLSGPGTVCLNARRTYRVAASAGVRIRWTVQGGSAESAIDRDTLAVRWLAAGTGTVRVTVTDTATGCATETRLDVSVGSSLQPVITASRNGILCQGDSVLLDAGAGFASYRWNTGATTPSIVVRVSGTYSVLVTDSSGCSGTSNPLTVRVNPLPAPVIAASGNTRFCDGDSVSLDAGAYASYRWNSGDTTRVVIVRRTGSFNVLVRDSAGCEGLSQSLDVLVSPKPLPVLSVQGPTSFCEGDSVVLSVQAGFATVRWPDSSAERTLIVKRSGVYAAEVSTGQGCNAVTDTVRITVHPRPVAIITGPSSLCLNSEARFSVAPFPGATYAWNSARGTAVAGIGTNEIRMRWSVVGPDTLSVRVTSADGCGADALFPIEVSTRLRPALSPAGRITLCPGDSVRISAQAGYASYLWTTGDSGVSILVSSTGRYAVHVRDATGCEGWSDTVDVRVTQAVPPVITLGGNAQFCEGDSVELDAGPVYRSYLWSNGWTGRRQHARSSGTYSVTVVDSNGCTAASQPVSLSVTPRPRPSVRASGPLEFCEGDSVVLSIPERYVRIRWNTGGTDPVFTVKSGGVYFAAVDSANGCSAETVPVAVIVHARPPRPAIVMTGDSLFAPAADAYRWFRNDTLLAGAEAVLLPDPVDGSYTVEVANQYGCVSRSLPFVVSRFVMSSVLSIPLIEAAPGDRISIPLRLDAARNFSRSGAAYTGTIAFDANLFHPIGRQFRDSAGVRFVDIAGGDASVSDSLALITGMVMLGDSRSTSLRVTRFTWGDSRIAVSAVAGELRVLVCEQGGTRLFDGTARFQISQNRPNPFNAETVIDVDLIEDGWTEIRVTDQLGRTVGVLHSGSMRAGRHTIRFHGGHLPSGVYFCTVSTPTARAFRIMEIVK